VMEAIYFIKGKKQMMFDGEIGSAIPRVGEKVCVRNISLEKGEDSSFEGKVTRVEWYFSSGNSGKPCVSVYLK
jgi:hypothetical protein